MVNRLYTEDYLLDAEVESCFYCKTDLPDDDAKLTSPTGFQVAELPLFLHVSISSSKMILASSELGCSDEIIATTAVLSILVKPLFHCNGCNLKHITLQSVWVIARTR
ncbi:hypothetical protein ARALYDRAFT_892912 [Arabidopsis lyrata subsp. lyrata]|uniref:Uncharacterized protein n=1 Tax=Arabidopsis lyrata subsp. lyrata TaxID=81972 RepID=D7KC87_ARALL|nr:hypothetical protein ARALYDRAFT_892912 [Arabidopsis lyrata subsp. lyrata]